MSVPTSTSKLQSGRTATQVIEMFRALENLLVTDDEKLIESKGKELKPLYQRWKNDPDPHKRAGAELWFKNLTALQQDRASLLQIVQEHFKLMANACVEGEIIRGVDSVTPELVHLLRQLAETECRCDTELVDRFLKEYLKENGLPVNEHIRPGTVEQFDAKSDLGHIDLKWTLPDKRWDRIEIVRIPTSLGRGPRSGGKDEVIFTIDPDSSKTEFQDHAQSGQWYRYTLHVHYVNLTDPGLERRAVCMAEVSNLRASWQDEQVLLEWDGPKSNAQAIVFKRVGTPPEIKRVLHGVEPADSDTQRLGGESSVALQDAHVTEDTLYFYRVLLDYGEGHLTNGQDVQIKIPPRPPAVTHVNTCYRQRESEHEIELEWPPVSFQGQVEYIVARREGSLPPNAPQTSERAGITRETRFLDSTVSPGHRYTYAVFTYCGGRYSAVGTASAVTDVVGEAYNPHSTGGDRTIELDWKIPPNVENVIVRRGLVAPRGPEDGEAVDLVGLEHARDGNLENGVSYQYLICCVYRVTGLEKVISRGVEIQEIPEPLPVPVQGFRVQVENREIVCSWGSPLPEQGKVVVIRSSAPSPWQPGTRLTVQEMDRLGERISCEPLRAVDAEPDAARPYYSVFSVGITRAIAGDCLSEVVVPEVTNLKLAATREGVVLRWTWPRACTAVRICRRHGDWPSSPDDAGAVYLSCARASYMDAGEKVTDTISSPGHYYYVVYAQAANAPAQFFSPGTDPGCRDEIEWATWMTLRYWFAAPEQKPKKKEQLHLIWNLENPLPDFAGFALIANQGQPPKSLDDGIELFRWSPSGAPVETRQAAAISLDPVRARGWESFFCKAMVVAPAQRHVTLIMHPDTTRPISARVQQPAQSSPRTGRVYKTGVPRTFACPICHRTFPLSEMLFESFQAGEPVKARYGWLDRLLRRPLQLPKDAQGRTLTRKICPGYDPAQPTPRHYLPFTAGAQESLLIGVIGATFSGKSHYIAALIERLKGQVALDMNADLMPVTDETIHRYEVEFYDPLFGKCLQLPQTAGTPPPLIYDLYLSGELFREKQRRGVTLALYDTAGENFKDPATVRDMVKYLRVASGVIFLVDPLQAPAVRQALPGSVPLPDQELTSEPHVVLQNVLTELENHHVLTQSEPFSIPAAVVLTKCDVLRDYGLLDANRFWNTATRNIGLYDLYTHDDMSGMIGECVQQWSLKAYTTVVNRFAHYAFFGVSATGCAPDKAGRYKYVSPWRVEDPLLWILAQLGVIPTRDLRKER